MRYAGVDLHRSSLVVAVEDEAGREVAVREFRCEDSAGGGGQEAGGDLLEAADALASGAPGGLTRRSLTRANEGGPARSWGLATSGGSRRCAAILIGRVIP
jgi:hypothetical protein